MTSLLLIIGMFAFILAAMFGVLGDIVVGFGIVMLKVFMWGVLLAFAFAVLGAIL